MERHIVGLGGGGDTPAQTALLHDYVLGLTGQERPRMLWVPTAAADSDEYTVWFYENFSRQAEVSTLKTFPWPPENLRELILSQDAICVSGGNTANMLAIWRVHGIDALMREAWEKGVLLWGASAGMICWFEAGVTDSFGPAARRDGVPRLAARAARARTTTARSAGGLAIRSSLRTGYPPGSQPTTASRSTTSARSCTRSSRAAREPLRTKSARTAKSGSTRASSAD